jgi:transposase-like protein
MTGKQVVLGLRERDGYTTTMPVSDSEAETLQNIIKQRVESGSSIYTDATIHIGGWET